MIHDDIVSLALKEGGTRSIEWAVVGLGLTIVCLDNGAAGLAYTLREELLPGCDAFNEAGNLKGVRLEEVLTWIGGGSILASSIGLAAANAVLRPPVDAFEPDLLETLALEQGERVVMVGRFRPMEPRLAELGVDLRIIEKGDPYTPLEDADVALITGTTVINRSIDEVLSSLRIAREVVLLGASTPYAPSPFLPTPVTILAGSTVLDVERARSVISEGGGIRALRGALGKWCVPTVG